MDIQQMQQELDDMILKRERDRGLNLSKEELLAYTFSALRVETAELQNELKTADGGFGHWKTKPVDIDKAKEEAIDCLHFFVSIFNQLNYKIRIVTITTEVDLEFEFDSAYEAIYWSKSHKIGKTDQWRYLKRYEYFLSVMFGYLDMTEQDVYAEYEKKYNENIRRQKEGY